MWLYSYIEMIILQILVANPSILSSSSTPTDLDDDDDTTI